MNDRRDATLVAIPSSTLEAFADALASGTLRPPLTEAALMSVGLDAMVPALPTLPTEGAEACVRWVLAERRGNRRPPVELVWTGPESPRSRTRDTWVALRELLAAAERSVLIAGYRFDHGAELFEGLYQKLLDGRVSARFFLDLPGHANDIAKVPDYAQEQIWEFIRTNWPFGAPYPEFYYDPRTITPRVFASMHAKCTVVDEARVLVGSANFTRRARERNIELGLLAEDPRLARDIVRQWQGLINTGLVSRIQP